MRMAWRQSSFPGEGFGNRTGMSSMGESFGKAEM
jgi:hypothetical protein